MIRAEGLISAQFISVLVSFDYHVLIIRFGLSVQFVKF